MRSTVMPVPNPNCETILVRSVNLALLSSSARFPASTLGLDYTILEACSPPPPPQCCFCGRQAPTAQVFDQSSCFAKCLSPALERLKYAARAEPERPSLHLPRGLQPASTCCSAVFAAVRHPRPRALVQQLCEVQGTERCAGAPETSGET